MSDDTYQAWLVSLIALANERHVDLGLDKGWHYVTYFSEGWSLDQIVDDVQIQGMELHKTPACQFCNGPIYAHKDHCPINNQVVES